MKKIFKEDILKTLLIVIAIIVVTLTLKPLILSLSSNLNKLGTAITQTATNTVPAVTNGGSGGSTSSGGSSIKSIQHVMINCFEYKNNPTDTINTKIYNISSINPSKTEVVIGNNIEIDYILTDTTLKVNSWKTVVNYGSYYFYYCQIIESTGSINSSDTVSANIISKYFTDRISVKLIEYN